MPKFFKTASSRIATPLYEAYDKICTEKGCSIHTDLKEYIERTVKPPEKKLNDDGRKLGENANVISKHGKKINGSVETGIKWFW